MSSSGTTANPRPISISIGTSSFPVRPVPFRVFPLAGEGALFRFENRTPYRASIDFGRHDLVFEEDGTTPVTRPLLVEPREDSRNLLVNSTLPVGVYAYKVSLNLEELRDTEFEATGCSRPEIEIRR